MKKSRKKIILNSLTITKLISTILMPFIAMSFGSIALLLDIFCIFILEGFENTIKYSNKENSKLNEYYSILSDDIFIIALLSTLSFSYPLLLISLVTEIGSAYYNVKSNIDFEIRNRMQKESYLDKCIKMSRALCLMIPILLPLVPHLVDFLGQTVTEQKPFNNLSHFVFDKLKDLINMINTNKNNIENIIIPSTIVTESINFTKNIINENKSLNTDEKRKKLIDELKEYRRYISDKYIDNQISNEQNNKETLENVKRLTKK